MISKISIRFNLSNDKIKRKFKDPEKTTGSQQLIAIVSLYPPIKITQLPDGGYWLPDPPNKDGKTFKGRISYGFADAGLAPEQRKKLTNSGRAFKGFKVNKAGELIKYDRLKVNTGIYILKESWDTKHQKALHPYAHLNNKVAVIRHIIDATFQDIGQRIDFTKEKFLTEIHSRIINGMPDHIVMPISTAYDMTKSIKFINDEIKKRDGIDIPDENNPNKVPDDLIDFIDFYLQNRTFLNKLGESTIDRFIQFQNKLKRWKIITGKTLSITKSELLHVSEFLKWRIYDNEENNVRNSEMIKSSNQISGVKKEAIGIGTLNKTKKDLKYFYNRATEEFSCKIRFSTKAPVLKDQKYDREMSDVYLSISQLKEIMNLQLENNSQLDLHRKLFIMGCLGGGFRISDLKILPKPQYEDFNGEHYYAFAVRSQKTKVKTLAPIPRELNSIIESFPFGLEVDENELRDSIKDLGELVGWMYEYSYTEPLADGTYKHTTKPFHKMLMPKTCRKTYCSLLYNFWGLTIQECMDFSGHETEEEFLKYLQIDKKVKAQKLIEKFKIKPIFEE